MTQTTTSSAERISSIKDVVQQILTLLQLPYDRIEVTDEDGMYRANIISERAAFLIGTHGERVDALQHITKSLLWSRLHEPDMFVVLDVDGYKREREEKFCNIATEKAELAMSTHMAQHLPPMDPVLRRIVHLHLKNQGPQGITTESEGEGADRHIVIKRDPHYIG